MTAPPEPTWGRVGVVLVGSVPLAQSLHTCLKTRQQTLGTDLAISITMPRYWNVSCNVQSGPGSHSQGSEATATGSRRLKASSSGLGLGLSTVLANALVEAPIFCRPTPFQHGQCRSPSALSSRTYPNSL